MIRSNKNMILLLFLLCIWDWKVRHYVINFVWIVIFIIKMSSMIIIIYESKKHPWNLNNFQNCRSHHPESYRCQEGTDETTVRRNGGNSQELVELFRRKHTSLPQRTSPQINVLRPNPTHQLKPLATHPQRDDQLLPQREAFRETIRSVTLGNQVPTNRGRSR